MKRQRRVNQGYYSYTIAEIHQTTTISKRGLSMKAKIIRALIAALITGTLLLAGTAPYGRPGINNSTILVSDN
jgi:hypothetical protein